MGGFRRSSSSEFPGHRWGLRSGSGSPRARTVRLGSWIETGGLLHANTLRLKPGSNHEGNGLCAAPALTTQGFTSVPASRTTVTWKLGDRQESHYC